MRSRPNCTAVIADIVNSRTLDADARRAVQEGLVEVLATINEAFAEQILSRFLVTLGDEFQGLLSDPSVLPDILWMVGRVEHATFRWGVGHGPLATVLRPEALGMDGPVWHHARDALESAARERRLGGVFVGFGDDDPVLDGLARLLHHQRSKLTEGQADVLHELRGQELQRRIAEDRGVSPQAIHKTARAAGWDAWREGELALRTVLRRYDTRTAWAEERQP